MIGRRGHFGLVLRVDEITARQVSLVGSMFAHGSGVVDPSQTHFTLYKSDGMEDLQVFSDQVLGVAHFLAGDIAKNGECVFSLGNLRVHGGKYLLWRASVSSAVTKAHDAATNFLSSYVSREQKQGMVDWARAQSPSIRNRDLELVHQYALQWVKWRNVPHLLCAFDPYELSKAPPRSHREHRGVFTRLELVRFGKNGYIEEVCLSIPIVPTFVPSEKS
jgi:hypothetical protein